MKNFNAVRSLSGIEVQQRSDGYVNASQLLKAHKIKTGETRKLANWTQTDRAKGYIAYVSIEVGIPTCALIVSNHGLKSGSWIHPDLAVPFATWLSIEFEFQVARWVQEWMAGNASPRNVGLELLLDGIARDHKSWECHFNPSWISEAERLTGWSWEWSCMAGFINKAVYSVLPLEVQERLDEVNPVLECGKRARKQHQHFSPSIDERILKQLIAETLGLMKGAASKQEFYRSHKNAYSKGIQLNLMIERGC